MVSYKQFVEEAMRSYSSLPTEPNDLYKKYYIDIPITVDGDHADAQKHAAAVEAMASSMEQRTMIKFDAIVSDCCAKSINPSVRIVRPQQLDPVLLDNKLFKSSEDKLAAFSNANSKYFVMIDAVGGKPVKFNLLLINEGNFSVQVVVNAAENSKVGIVEICASSGKGTMAVLNEISAKQGAEVELDVLHNENEGTDVASLCKAVAAEKSKVRVSLVFTGGRLTRSKNIIDASGIGSEVDVSEIAFGSAEQKFDLGTSMTNTTAMSTARLESGTVLDGKAQCMLKGYAKVPKGAKGCLSRITERGILLSKDAHVDALPDMSIDYSNEVKATHSAATAPIDKEALFYLMSRGLEEEKARRVFITAFMARYLSNMKDGLASEVAMSIMLEKLERGTFGVMPDVTTRGVWMASRPEGSR
jgi:Fe-S cluster assembly scaffold protein SufB